MTPWTGALSIAGRTSLWWSIMLVAIGLGIASSSAAEPRAVGKRKYNLFRPVPRELMRELASERPSVTESPITLDAGHFQIDTALFGYEFDDRGTRDQETYTALESTLGVGLTRRLAAQLVLTPYRYEKVGASTASGFGEIRLRLKGNLWGNDPEPDERTAFAIIADIAIPTGTEVSTEEVEGSVIGVLGWNLSDSFSLSSQVEFDFTYDDQARKYQPDFVHTLNANTTFFAPFGFYIEYVGKAAVSDGPAYRPGLGTGAAYAIGENVQLDIDLRVGFGDTADLDNRPTNTGRLSASTGFTARF